MLNVGLSNVEYDISCWQVHGSCNTRWLYFRHEKKHGVQGKELGADVEKKLPRVSY